FPVGVAPCDVVVVGTKAFVSNGGGRRPEANSIVGPAGRGTFVRVDPRHYVASEGSVSVIDLRAGRVLREIPVGLHSSGLALTPDQRYLAVANAASDTVSIIDTRSDHVVETIVLRWQPEGYFGASPNALVFDPEGQRLYVCNGTQNAVAVVSFQPGHSTLKGLIPVGWFPGAILFDQTRRTLVVANIKGLGSGRRTFGRGEKGFNSRQYFGSISLIPVPDDRQLERCTRTVLTNCRRELIEASQLPARPGQTARPVPERVGEPSVLKHVVYIIKENRTYDQVLGDLGRGRGDPNLCIFGERVTPNLHKIVREFVLLDNTYCSGILSADGHEWATTAMSTDYMEKSFAGFPRSYPDGMSDDDVDALAYAPSGFIWDNALERGKTLRDYGEFSIAEIGWTDPFRWPPPTFIDIYRDFIGRTGLTRIGSRPAIESLRPYLDTKTVGHSRFWKETCIFAIEDDPQDGWDHVSSFRTTAYVVSPYTRRGAVVSTQYNQPGILRTIELILGLPPMNQMDAAATPLFDCFQDEPDFTPYEAVPNIVPLDLLNPPVGSWKDERMRRYAELSTTLPLKEVDRCPEDLLNRILWHARKGPDTPYPEWATAPEADRD
ncbi:MAG: bifunctional YncE family protein/alkaline phosphatase family protein, partial [Acidobacteriota bacterium]